MQMRFCSSSLLVLVTFGCGAGAEAPRSPAAAQQGLEATPAEVARRLGPALAPLVDDAWSALDATHGPEQLALEVARALAAAELRGTRLGELASARPIELLRRHAGRGDDVVAFVQGLLDDASHEGAGAWRLHGEALCASDCAAIVEALELRARLELAGEAGLAWSVRVGPTEEVLLGGVLEPGRLTADLDLAVARAVAVRALAGVTLAWPLPERVDGTLRATLAAARVPLALHAGLALPTGLEVVVPLPPGPVNVRIAATDALATIDATSADGTLRAGLGAGRIEVALPWRGSGKRLSVDAAGVSGALVLASGSGVIALEGVGLGEETSRAALDGDTVVAVDLDAAAGRRLDVAVRLQDRGWPVVEVRPSLELVVPVHLAPFAALGEQIPSFLLDETYRALAEGPPAVQPTQVAGRLGLLVQRGLIDLSSSAEAEHVTARAGATMTLGAARPGAHPLLGHVHVQGP